MRIVEVPNGDIDFDHVNFAYKKDAEEFVLEDIDLHIKSGETIGVLGGTGSAKSTLVNLISRLYDVSEGDVKVGGIDVRSYEKFHQKEFTIHLLNKGAAMFPEDSVSVFVSHVHF